MFKKSRQDIKNLLNPSWIPLATHLANAGIARDLLSRKCRDAVILYIVECKESSFWGAPGCWREVAREVSEMLGREVNANVCKIVNKRYGDEE